MGLYLFVWPDIGLIPYLVSYHKQLWFVLLVVLSNFVDLATARKESHSCPVTHAVLRMYIVPVVVMATLTTEAILTILGCGKQSEYPGIQRYSDHPGIVPGWVHTTHNPPCQSIPGFGDTLTIPEWYWDGHTPHTTPLVRVSQDLEILWPSQDCTRMHYTIHHTPCPNIPGSRDTLTILGQYWDEHAPHTTPLVRISRDPEILSPRVYF